MAKRCKKTYNSRYSLVVTDPTTNLPITCLVKGERTGSHAFMHLWSYVLDEGTRDPYQLSLWPTAHLGSRDVKTCHHKIFHRSSARSAKSWTVSLGERLVLHADSEDVCAHTKIYCYWSYAT